MCEQGIPIFSGEPELFDEYLDRVETLVHQYTEEVIKKQGPLAPRLYNGLKGEAYMAAKAANIAKAELAKPSGVELLIVALKSCIQGVGPTRVGEIFDKYFDGGKRKAARVSVHGLQRAARYDSSCCLRTPNPLSVTTWRPTSC